MPSECELIVKNSSKFSKYFAALTNEENDNNIDLNDISFGGIIRKGQLGWRAKGSYFEVCSLKTGQKLSDCYFDSNIGCGNCIVTCVCEIDIPILNESLLAIGIQYGDSSGSIMAIFSIQESRVLRCIELNEKVTTCHFIKSDISKRTILNIMDECLAIGTDAGKIILLDMNWHKCENEFLQMRGDGIDTVTFVRCHLANYNMDIHKMRQICLNSKKEKNANFGILLETPENTGLVLCLNSIIQNLSLVSGFEDGRLTIYDLCDLRLYHVTLSDSKSPLVKLSFMEPPDDPRPCIYIWAFHENSKESVAIMHLLMYEKRLIEDDGVCLYENFQSSRICLILPTFEKNSLPVVCQAITKPPSNDDEEIISICLLSWKTEVHTVVLIFDINQWYKEEMPPEDDWRENLSYLAAFKIKYLNPLDIYVDINTVALFNSIQRPEEHFYPIAMSFDCTLLQTDGSYCLHWPGLQNRAIQLLNAGGPMAILEPTSFFEEIIRASLLPQFCEMNINSVFSLNMQREILLSIAIEYNCTHLLWECAKSWSDGSHLGRNIADGLTLSTMTDWIWKRASNIKNRCNVLCKTLFDYSGSSLDRREKKELSYLSRQLKLLSELLNSVLTKWSRNIPKSALDKLENQEKSLQSASEYQEILLWLLNIGLLPESFDHSSRNHLDLVPYPYDKLKKSYESQRANFAKLNENFVSLRTKSCRILFIDSFIEHECNATVLRDHWLESGGNGLYPPPSLQAMLRTILIPEVSFDKKCALFLYFFLDLNMTVKDGPHREIVANLIKFPTVFKLTASLIKTVQAFWSLDHGDFQMAIEEIISPFYIEQNFTQWQLELLIETLLAQNQPNYALRILHALKSPLSPILELKTLLANNLIGEAFHFARKKNNVDILSLFFTGCLCMGKYNVFRDLALTEEEGEIVVNILKNHRTIFAENLRIVYLLQKSKYIDAISYLEELSKTKSNKRQTDIDTPSLILSAYNITMTPVTRTLIDTYYKLQKRIKDKEVQVTNPYPLSCQLIKKNANNLLGGIYQSTALGTHFATYYCETNKDDMNRLRDAENAPFIRKLQLQVLDECSHRENISYPDEFKAVEKRQIYDEFDHASENPLKKRKLSPSTISVLVPQNQTTTSINSSLLTKIKLRTIEKGTSEHQTKTFYSSNNPSDENKSVKLSNSLNTPIVKNILDSGNNAQSSSVLSNKTLSIHSILKVKSNSQSNSEDEENINNSGTSQSLLQEESGDEEKSIRFKLPKNVDIENNRMVTDFVDDEAVNLLHYSEEPSERKSLYSLDGINSSTTTFDSVESYYSPPSSSDTSRYLDVSENTITETITNVEDDNREEKLPMSRHFYGAQPRRPLSSVRRSCSISAEKLNSESCLPDQNMEWGPNDQLISNQCNLTLTTTSTTKEPTLLEENEQNPNELNIIPIKNDDLTKINTSNFKPFISSSKVEYNESKFVEEKTNEVNKFLEKSTVIGGVTYMESATLIARSKLNETPTDFNKEETTVGVNNQEMDTTIDMSGSDVTAFGTPDQLFSDSSYLNINVNDNDYKIPNVFGDDPDPEYTNNIYDENEDIPTFIDQAVNIEEAKSTLLNEINPIDTFSHNEESDVEVMEDSNLSENNVYEQNNSEIFEEEDDENENELYDKCEIFNLESSNSQDSNESVNESDIETASLEIRTNYDVPNAQSENDNAEIICLTSSSESSDSEDKISNNSEDDNNDNVLVEKEIDVKDFGNQYTSLSESCSETPSSEECQSQLLYGGLDIDEQCSSNQSKKMEILDVDLKKENIETTSTEPNKLCEQNLNTIEVEIIRDKIIQDETQVSVVEDPQGSNTMDIVSGNISEEIHALKSSMKIATGETNIIRFEKSNLSMETEFIEDDKEEVSDMSKDCINSSQLGTKTIVINALNETYDKSKNVLVDVTKETIKVIENIENPKVGDETNYAEPKEVDEVYTSLDEAQQNIKEADSSLEKNVGWPSTTNLDMDIRIQVSDDETEQPIVDISAIVSLQLHSINTDIEIKETSTNSTIVKRGFRSVSEPPTERAVELGTQSKIRTRRQSNALSKIEENVSVDSPFTRTRLRTRQSSTENFTNTSTRTRYSVVQPDFQSTDPLDISTKSKSKRSISMQDMSTDVTQTTPRTTRAQSVTTEISSKLPAKKRNTYSNAIADQEKRTPFTTIIDLKYTLTPEIRELLPSDQTPKKTRARSVTNDQVSSATPTKRIMTRLLSTTKELSPVPDKSITDEEAETILQNVLKTKISPVPEETDYSSSRRLTRNQLAIMKKSAQYATASETLLPPSKESLKCSPSKSDDNESTSSKISHRSNLSTNRRVTRSSRASYMDENDLDNASQSSKSNEKKRKKVRKDNDDWRTQSPESLLLAIGEKMDEVSSDNESNTSSVTSVSKKSKRGRKPKV